MRTALSPAYHHYASRLMTIHTRMHHPATTAGHAKQHKHH